MTFPPDSELQIQAWKLHLSTKQSLSFKQQHTIGDGHHPQFAALMFQSLTQGSVWAGVEGKQNNTQAAHHCG